MTHEAVGAVLLAAGRASRYGAPKQLVPVAGIPMVRRAALAALQCSGRTVVVTGAHRMAVEACLRELDVELAFNSAWQHGMGGSIACGIERLMRLQPEIRACLILLVDQPLVTATDLAALIDAHQQHPGCIIASDYGGNTLGAPCLFSCRHFEELMALEGPSGARPILRLRGDAIGTCLPVLEGPSGARPILRSHSDKVRAVSNPRASVDIDMPEDRRRWLGGDAIDGLVRKPPGDLSGSSTGTKVR